MNKMVKYGKLLKNYTLVYLLGSFIHCSGDF